MLLFLRDKNAIVFAVMPVFGRFQYIFDIFDILAADFDISLF